MTALEVRGVSFSYDNKSNTIENINITLNKGEIVCLLGVSGALSFNGLIDYYTKAFFVSTEI